MKNKYTTKHDRNTFFRWIVDNYGYERSNVPDNSRILSNKYSTVAGVNIPKITIHRWLKKFDKYIIDTYTEYAKDYISLTTEK